MTWTQAAVLGVLFILWSYVLARMVTRAVLRSLREETQGE